MSKPICLQSEQNLQVRSDKNQNFKESNETFHTNNLRILTSLLTKKKKQNKVGMH